MAFAIRNLSVLAYANGFTLWHYKAAGDDPQIVASTAYFNDAADMLASGDIVMISAPNGGKIVCIAAEQGCIYVAPLG